MFFKKLYSKAAQRYMPEILYKWFQCIPKCSSFFFLIFSSRRIGNTGPKLHFIFRTKNFWNTSDYDNANQYKNPLQGTVFCHC